MSDDVRTWLEELGLGEYSATFAHNAIDADVLPDLSDADLEKIGVKLGHRKKLLKAIATIERKSPPERRGARGKPSQQDEHLAAWERHPGERKPVTLLFADIANSTAITEALDAEDTHSLLYGATQRMCEAVESCRGTVCRFMGDGVMAMFGAPIASEHHAVEACEAALAMQRAIGVYSKELERSIGRGLRIRVGLHSGEIVLLKVGEGEKVEYDASGPTVPIAARIEQVAEPGEVYLTAATERLAAHRIDADPLEPVSAKGISEPVNVFALRRVRSVEAAQAHANRTPFVGRRAELNQFRGVLDACIEDGHGETVYIRGEPGIGKTRLIEEFERIAGERGASVHRGLVLAFGVAEGQDAIRSLVNSLLGVSLGSEDSVRQRAAAEALSDGHLAPGQGVFLCDLLDLPQSKEQRALYDAMDNDTRNLGKQAVVSALVTAISRKRSVLVIIEDVHWADTVTLGHLAALAKTVSACKALLVMSSRVEGDQLTRSWRARTDESPFATIDLGPLRRQDSMALISEFLDPDNPLAQSCLERAAGNPLFLEQLLRTANERSSESLPNSIQSLVLARLDRLPAADKRALQAASVIGQRFDLVVLRHLIDTESYDCRDLLEHNLVRLDGSSYLFAHALVQEGVYASLLKHQRHDLHRKAAESYRGNDSALHAEHLASAEDERAPKAFIRAAREQAERYRFARSLDLANRGLTLARKQTDEHELTCLKGELLRDLAEVEASIAAYRQAQENAVDDVQRADAWMGIAAGLRITMANCEEALTLLDRAEAVATSHAQHSTLTKLHHLRGNLFFPLGRISDCYEQHRLALEFANRSASPEDQARAFGGLGDAEYARGRMRTAYGHYSRCIELSGEHGFGRMEVSHLAQRGYTRLYSGDWLAAKTEAIAAAKAATEVGDRRAEMNAASCVFHAALDLGENDLVEAYAKRQLNLARALGASTWGSDAFAWGALVLRGKGCVSEARELLDQGTEIARTLARGFQAGRFFGAAAWVLAEDDAAREAALSEGQGALLEGSLSHNYLWFYRFGIEALLEVGEWNRVDDYAAALEDYTRDEPLGWTDFYIARGRALAAFGRGSRDDATLQALRQLREQAERAGLVVSLVALKEALR